MRKIEDIAYMWQNYFDEEENLIEMNLHSLLKMNGKFERFEIHQQRAYTEDEIVDMLEKSGFKDIKYYGDLHLTNLVKKVKESSCM